MPDMYPPAGVTGVLCEHESPVIHNVTSHHTDKQVITNIQGQELDFTWISLFGL